MGWERECPPPVSPLKAIKQLQSFLLASLGPSREEQRERRCVSPLPLSTAFPRIERVGRGKGRCPLQGHEAEGQSFGERGR